MQNDNEKPIRRSTYIWLGLLGAAVGLITVAALASGQAASVAGALVVVAAYVGLAAVTVANRTVRRLSQNIKMPPIRMGVHTTAVARRAMGRAYKSSVFNPDNILTDVGLIFNRRGRDSSWDRHLVAEDQSIVITDAGLQPFAKINVLPASADKIGVIAFQIYDQAGRLRFSRQTEQMIRPGENTILCDRQLPLLRGEPVTRSGTWDLRIVLNGEMIGIHSFSVKPSAEQRRNYFSSDAEAAIDNLKLPEADGPTTLDDLLKEQQHTESGRRR
ncbi:MAG TPA: hypothetical protein VMT34_13945 [Aggregatilineales bacterium]|nr:hypothetical protein [Aggregatilineales bacterium]